MAGGAAEHLRDTKECRVEGRRRRYREAVTIEEDMQQLVRQYIDAGVVGDAHLAVSLHVDAVAAVETRSSRHATHEAQLRLRPRRNNVLVEGFDLRRQLDIE